MDIFEWDKNAYSTLFILCMSVGNVIRITFEMLFRRISRQQPTGKMSSHLNAMNIFAG